MKPLKRSPVNKHKAAKHFKKAVSHTQKKNVQMAPMRGGWRL